jgi:hypothetical protein
MIRVLAPHKSVGLYRNGQVAGVALALGFASAARAQNTLTAPNMPVCPAQVEGSSADAGELDGDVLIWTLVTSSTPKGSTQTRAHKGSFQPTFEELAMGASQLGS